MRTWGLETAVEQVPGGAIVTAKGRVGRVTARRFAEALSAARRGTSTVAVDLTGVDYVSGLGLLALRETADSADALILCGVGEPLRNTLELAGLLERVKIEDNRQAAIDRLRTIAGA
jgi:anti-anti-sigma factor